ncbi:hypothetical protein StoSoilA2_26220 [Arthrobacter sp. StoSoilA2]|uniref:hypothetical protein n=1 Tax=Arthrobacter sp. StoSoilA2 TaxID=2830990 RepID=UPI001CC6AF71|nr:hypothetical protein [Arthrobacter sp. StoSoilA2]BCW36566.1 hypothetical protein StoSoilA2_26220 [Arthrobacter sp. StoSoilA2]
MQDNAGFYAPLQYQQLWLWLGLVLLLLVACWYGWILWPDHKATPKTPVGGNRTPHDLETLRATCLSAIDTLEREADAGRLPGRDAHQRLSLLVREFAGAATGLPATSMTLEELRRNGLDQVAVGIALIYPNEFAPVALQSVRDSARTARQVVQAWN